MIRLILRSFPLITLIALAGISLLPARSAQAIGFAECATVTFDNPTPTPECLSLIEAHLDPVLIEVPRDGYTLSNYSYWRVITEGYAPVFEAPDGGVVREIEPGFNFVIATDTSSAPGWIGIQGGGWMRDSDLRYTPASNFRGVQVLDGLAQPFGWVMFNLFPASYPGGQQDINT